MYQLDGKELAEVLKLAFEINALLNDRQIIFLEAYIVAIKELREDKKRVRE